MSAPTVIIHERVSRWATLLRPRFADADIRWSESRTAATLTHFVRREICPILLIPLDRDPIGGLRDLDAALASCPHALSLVLDPRDRGEVLDAAREIGATLCLGGTVVPPEVERIVHRWLPIAKLREEAEGWSAATEPTPEVWDDPERLFFPLGSLSSDIEPD
jgi:hypothetical protein